MSDRPVDPYTRHRFEVEIDGWEPLGFSEISGLTVRVETGAAADDADAPSERGILDIAAAVSDVDARETAAPTLTLRRGATDDHTLWDWLRGWVDGAVEPRDVAVYLLDSAGSRGRGWRCRDATPVRWRGPELVADSPGVATETLELTHEGIEAITGDE